MTPPRALIEPMEPSERLSADDLASRREEEFISAALVAQQQRAAAGDQAQHGTCSNCGEACPPRARYCDPDCQADHEARLTVLARQRGR